MAATIEERLQTLIDDDLLEAYADAVRHWGTPDLVLCLDVEKHDLRTMVRTKFESGYRAFLGEKAGESDLLRKVGLPAANTMKHLKTNLAFWLVVDFPDGQQACLAVGGQRVATDARGDA